MLKRISKLSQVNSFNQKKYFCTNRHYGNLLKLPYKDEYLYKNESDFERYIDIFRKFSHYYAKIDPLNLNSK